MGASNAMAAYALWAGKVPATSFLCLAYMALVSKDSDARPWYGQGHQALAEHALGRPLPIGRADVKAVERAMEPLAKAGAITVDRRAAPRRDGPTTVRYRLNLDPFVIPRNVGDVEAPNGGPDPSKNGRHTPRNVGEDSTVLVDAEGPLRPPVSGQVIPRNPGSHPPENGLTSPGNRGTEEPRGTKRSEKTEEYVLDLDTAVTVLRATDTANKPDLPLADSPPDDPPPAVENPRCPTHPAMTGGTRPDGLPECPPCRALSPDRARGQPPPDPPEAGYVGRRRAPDTRPDLRLIEGGHAA